MKGGFIMSLSDINKSELDPVPIKYKMDVLEELKSKGYNTKKLRTDGLLAESTIQQLRKGVLVSWRNIARLCELLQCDIGDIVMYDKQK